MDRPLRSSGDWLFRVQGEGRDASLRDFGGPEIGLCNLCGGNNCLWIQGAVTKGEEVDSALSKIQIIAHDRSPVLRTAGELRLKVMELREEELWLPNE